MRILKKILNPIDATWATIGSAAFDTTSEICGVLWTLSQVIKKEDVRKTTFF